MNNNTNKRFNVDDIIEYLSDEETATDFLNNLEVSPVEEIRDTLEYRQKHYHKGLVLEVKEAYNDDPIDITIDLKEGQPTIEQVYHAVYGNGSNCTKRIIMFTGENLNIDRDDPAADETVVQSLVNAMNEYPVNLYLFKITDWNPETREYQFEIVAKPERSPDYNLEDLPSIGKFREAEFWCVYFDSLNEGFYRSFEAFDGGITKKCEYGFYREGDGVDVSADWTEDGMIFTAQAKGEDPDVLTNIFISKSSDLHGLFPGGEIKYTGIPGKSSELCITKWNIPISQLINTTPNEKKGYAMLLWEGFYRFYDFLGEAGDELGSESMSHSVASGVA